MKTNNYKIWTVFCKCGSKLVRYRKMGPGRLVKIHRDRIAEDLTEGQVFMNFSEVGTEIDCPACKNRIATIQKVSGKFVNKVNQGQIGLIRK